MVAFFPVTEKDLSAIKEIYDYYILNSTATFHNIKISMPELKEFLFIAHPDYPHSSLWKTTGPSDIAS